MKVEPIRNKRDIYEIEDRLFSLQTARGERMFLMFEVGIFLGMRIGDMLQMKVGDIRGKESYTFTPQKTDTHVVNGVQSVNYRPKVLTVTIPPELRKVVSEICADRSDQEPLFTAGRRDRGGYLRPLDRTTAYRDMKEIGRVAGLQMNIGCHTLRKTFGYHLYKKNHDVAWLQNWFQHSSPAVTMVYIGIADDEKKVVTDHMPFENRSRFDWKARKQA